MCAYSVFNTFPVYPLSAKPLILLAFCRYRYHTSLLFTPESFEWLLLNSNILNKPYILDILKEPYNYIESSEFFSWENYFTELLNKATRESEVVPYSKGNNKSIRMFTTEKNMKKIIESSDLRYLLKT